MKLSQRANDVSESITLKLNEKATRLMDSGQLIYNLTASQLPFRPMTEFVEKLEGQLRFLKSYQYSPVMGFTDLRKKMIDYVEKSRGISFSQNNLKYECILSNGSKHTIYNLLGAIIDPGDEVVLIAPYWVSYPEMVRFWGGEINVVKSHSYDGFVPAIEDLRAQLTNKTKAIIINSPNNPTGIYYSDEWMRSFAELMEEYPDLIIISDEIYREICYFDPRPTFFYQHKPQLLERTIIIDGISKSLASTGLRIGYCIAPEEVALAMGRIQGQTTSGPNSLVQRAMSDFNFDRLPDFLNPVKIHLRRNASILREKFREAGLSSVWYQSTSAFYFMLDYSRTPMFGSYAARGDGLDYSQEISERLLDEQGVAVVPGTAFGCPNSARISIILEENPFNEALDRLLSFLVK